MFEINCKFGKNIRNYEKIWSIFKLDISYKKCKDILKNLNDFLIKRNQ